jgi:Ser/Thr protein kinase RdoA (MazF antagonist)
MNNNNLPQHMLQAFGITDEPEITKLPGNENDNYLVRSSEDAFVVKRLRSYSAESTEHEALYRQHLAAAGLPVVPYVTLHDGRCVYTDDNGDLYVAAPYVDGTIAEPSAAIVKQAGKLLAKVHLLDTTSLPERHTWFSKAYVTDSLPLISDDYTEAKTAMAQQFADLPDFWDGSLPAGITHSDLHEGNLLTDVNETTIVGMLDWEDATIAPLVLDTATCAYQLSKVNEKCDAQLFDAFMDVYQQIRLLTDKEKQLFDDAVRYSRLVLSVWAHIKYSRGEMGRELFERVGNYYRQEYEVPAINLHA